MRAERRMRLALPALLGLLIAALPAHAQPVDSRLCDDQTVLQVSPETGDVQFSRQKVDEGECDEIGAAIGELSPDWRQRLPRRVRWLQRSDSAELCSASRSAFGERVGRGLGSPGCVFLSAPEACTIVSASALSHAQLANAVRDCTN